MEFSRPLLGFPSLTVISDALGWQVSVISSVTSQVNDEAVVPFEVFHIYVCQALLPHLLESGCILTF